MAVLWQILILIGIINLILAAGKEAARSRNGHRGRKGDK